MRNLVIDNTGFINKGAELMLRSIVQHYSTHTDVNLVYNGAEWNASWKQKAELGLFSIVKLQRFRINFNRLFSNSKFHNYGLINLNEVNYFLDSGGFHIGDQWITELSTQNKINQKLDFYRTLKKNGVKIIFLPQAFGPFEKNLSAFLFKKLYEIGDLFFARDKTSYENCQQLIGDTRKLHLFPDFTNIYIPAVNNSSKFSEIKQGICIIPNSKMLSHTTEQLGEKYILFMENIVDDMVKNGEKVFFLNHEGQDDFNLIQNLNKHKLPVISGVNANDVKYIIGQSKIILSSRFHGVVSGLSQGIPTFCTSWSHKYKEIMKDYSFSDGVLDIVDSEIAREKIFYYLNDQNNLNQLKSALKKKSILEKKKTLEMWKIVDTILFN